MVRKSNDGNAARKAAAPSRDRAKAPTRVSESVGFLEPTFNTPGEKGAKS